MKELVQIIDQLHEINKEIVERDNLINQYDEMIGLFEQLVKDDDFKKSDIYLGMRAKYLGAIEKKIEQICQSEVQIEPATIQCVDIYSRPKASTAAASTSRKSNANANTNANAAQVQTSPDGLKVIQFQLEGQTFYISVQSMDCSSDGDDVPEHQIYNQNMKTVGSLKRNKLMFKIGKKKHQIQLKTRPAGSGGGIAMFPGYSLVNPQASKKKCLI